MLTVQERTLVAQKAQAYLLPSGNKKNALVAIFAPDETAVLEEIERVPETAAAYACAAVCVCVRDRWNRNPSLMERLLTELVNAGAAELAAVLDRVRAAVDPNLDPLRTSWMTAQLPFFGRPEIRAKIRHLLDCCDKAVFTVQGPEKSGKTYTSDWLDYIAAEGRCDFRIVVEKLEKGSGPTMSPDLLADSLVSKMGRPRTGMPAPGSDRYEKRLCNWIIDEALQAPGRTWIVLDGFDDKDLDRRSAALIQELAGALQTGSANRRLRLVLLDFRSRLAQVNPIRIETERLVRPEDVDAKVLRECLWQHFTDIGQPVDQTFVDALADKLIQDAVNLRTQPEYAEEPRLGLLNLVLYNFRYQDLKKLGRVV
jgi:hypothetical protein